MDRKAELAADEDGAWVAFCALVDRLTPEQLEQPGYTPEGWSVKDLLWHVGAWAAECAHVLERVRMGTFEDEAEDTDALNREWFELSRTLDLQTVRAEFVSGRNRMLHEWEALKEITPAADEWFEETGPIHYREHAKDLGAWVERLTAGAEG